VGDSIPGFKLLVVVIKVKAIAGAGADSYASAYIGVKMNEWQLISPAHIKVARGISGQNDCYAWDAYKELNVCYGEMI
jgi:hypothetical protein